MICEEGVRLSRPGRWMLSHKREPMRAARQLRGSINLHQKQKILVELSAASKLSTLYNSLNNSFLVGKKMFCSTVVITHKEKPVTMR